MINNRPGIAVDIKADINSILIFKNGYGSGVRIYWLKFHVMALRCRFFAVFVQKPGLLRTCSGNFQNKSVLELTLIE